VDKPFLYIIREKTSNAIVFMGKVGNPEYKD
jgi:serine protease inhibitor